MPIYRYYCEKCKKINEEEKCPNCKSKCKQVVIIYKGKEIGKEKNT